MQDSASSYKELREQAEKIVALRQSKAFRRKVFFARLKEQLLKGTIEEKRDFLAFVAAKLGRKGKEFRPLSDFDPTGGIERQTADSLISAYSSAEHGAQVAVFSRLPYHASGDGQRGAQIAKTFKRMGYDVLYFYLGDNFYSFDRDFVDEVSLHLPLIYFDEERLCSILEPGAIAIFENPDVNFLPYLYALKEHGVKTVYEHIDNWETALGAGWYDRGTYLSFVKGADLLIGTARNLCEMVSKDAGRPVLYNANAVDIELFDHKREYSVPDDVIKGEKTLLYYGHLKGQWLDWDLLYDTAELCPECSFMIIGFGEPGSERRAPVNVHFLGARKQRSLPAYLAASDMGMLHFKTGEIGKYVSPLKIFEYLAMHKRVLSTPLPDIENYPNVFCSTDPAAWAAAIKNPPKEEQYDAFVEGNSWYARCRAIIAEVAKSEA